MGTKNYFFSISQHSGANVPTVKTRSSPEVTGIPCHARPQVTLNILMIGEYCSWEYLYCKENLTVVSRRQFEARHCDVIWRPAGWPSRTSQKLGLHIVKDKVAMSHSISAGRESRDLKEK